jgi:hypothetical protein
MKGDSTFNGRVESDGDDVEPSSLRVSVKLHHLKDGFAARVNTLGAYVELNRQASFNALCLRRFPSLIYCFAEHDVNADTFQHQP